MRMLLIMAMSIWATGGVAQDNGIPGNQAIEGCRSFLAMTRQNVLNQGLCAGIATTVVSFGNRLAVKSCVPDAVTIAQSVRVLVAFMDKHPERLHEQTVNLAMYAFAEAWPCK